MGVADRAGKSLFAGRLKFRKGGLGLFALISALQEKVAGLLSADIPIQTPPPSQVPDGGSSFTLALFGLGAVGAAFRKIKTA